MAQKFLFDTSFEAADIAERESAIPLALHEEALASRYEQGFQDGREEAQAGIDAQNTLQLEDLNRKILALLDEQKRYRHKVQTLLGSVLKVSLEKLFPALAEAHGLEEIVKVVEQTFQTEPPSREIGVFVAPQTRDALQEKLASLSVTKEEAVCFKVQDDSGLSFSDCRLTWEGGGLERLSQRLYEEIQVCLDRLSITETLEIPDDQVAASPSEATGNLEEDEQSLKTEQDSSSRLDNEPSLEVDPQPREEHSSKDDINKEG